MFLKVTNNIVPRAAEGEGRSHDLAELSVFKQNYHQSNGKAGSLPVKTSAALRGSLRGRQLMLGANKLRKQRTTEEN